jgi:REP element-mobilizing transposase RayT
MNYLLQGWGESALQLYAEATRKDHVHILLAYSTHIALSKLALYLKGRSSRQIQDKAILGTTTYVRADIFAHKRFCNRGDNKEYIENQNNQIGKDIIYGKQW